MLYTNLVFQSFAFSLSSLVYSYFVVYIRSHINMCDKNSLNYTCAVCYYSSTAHV